MGLRLPCPSSQPHHPAQSIPARSCTLVPSSGPSKPQSSTCLSSGHALSGPGDPHLRAETRGTLMMPGPPHKPQEAEDTADRHKRKGDAGVGPEHPNLRECWPTAQSCHLQAGLLSSSLCSLPESDSLPSWKKSQQASLLWSLFLTGVHLRTRC